MKRSRSDHEAGESEMFRRFFRCLNAIPDGKPGTAGEVACPECGGTIRYSRAPNNRHLRAICSTPNCFAVIQ